MREGGGEGGRRGRGEIGRGEVKEEGGGRGEIGRGEVKEEGGGREGGRGEIGRGREVGER